MKYPILIIMVFIGLIFLTNKETKALQLTMSNFNEGNLISNNTTLINSSIGDIIEYINNDNTIIKIGFASKIYDEKNILIQGNNIINESSTNNYISISLLDDLTLLQITNTVIWNLRNQYSTNLNNSPYSLISDPVYQNTNIQLFSYYNTMTGLLDISVLNINRDNYYLYANDNIEDSWQVYFFDTNNNDALPLIDYDEDGWNNLSEFNFGTDPLNNKSTFKLWVNSVQNTNVIIKFYPSFYDRQYTLQENHDLNYNYNWINSSFNNILIDNLTNTIYKTSTNKSEFYRIKVDYDW